VLTCGQLPGLLARLPEARVAVIGDFCLDVYWHLDMQASEVSLETGKSTQPVREQRHSLGGAGNVVANLVALGVGHVSVFGAVGDDPFGSRMSTLLTQRGVDCDGLQCVAEQGAWQTLAYCKPYVGDEELSRLDMGSFNALPDALAIALLESLEARLPALDVVVVNQQVIAGIHTELLRRELRALMRRHPEAIFVFDGRHHTDSYPDAWLKVNDQEALRLCDRAKDPQELVLRDEATDAASRLFERTRHPVFVTRGARGCVVCTESGLSEIPGLQVIGRVDTVGAGDSFLAGLSAALAVDATPEAAAQVGNFTARVTVTKLKQTGTATPEELLTVGTQPHYIYEPELADDPRGACYWSETAIEVVREVPTDLTLRYAIFDHDGTISTLRQGWEHVMEPMMVRSVLGPEFAAADEGLYHRVVGRVREFIDQTTGIQTLSQMQGLVGIVREFGFISEDQVLDMHGYKGIYNEALMERVQTRLSRLAAGELDVDDFVVKNAVKCLEALHQVGVKLYLASGTDEADVVAEARAMGYDHLFEGRIFGATGDVRREAKRIVLERILAEIGGDARLVVTFGDGPVEIRETRLRGGTAVGVASDELRRFDLNPAKRSRLIRAGASLIIPDFSQLQDLLALLRI